MIGKIMIGKSFRGCLLYCLHDKQQNGEQAVVKDRAEVLVYNKCFGSDKDLIQQFNEVRLLNQKVAKPVLHITLSLAPGEQLGKDQLMEIAGVCATDLGFQKNQYIAVLHRDTGQQHLHIVANRIGLDGRTVSDSNSYKKMALFCRRMEIKYELKQVLSPRRYLSREQRQLPRLDARKEKLREHIWQSLSASKTYTQFEENLKALGYQVIKGRGIAFLDQKGVKVKGSELGYSLRRIEYILQHGPSNQQSNNPFQAMGATQERGASRALRSSRTSDVQKLVSIQEKQAGNILGRSLDLLLAPEQQLDTLSPELLKKKKKKRLQHL